MSAFNDKFSRESKTGFANLLRDTANMIDNNIYDEDIARRSMDLAMQIGFEIIVKSEEAKEGKDK